MSMIIVIFHKVSESTIAKMIQKILKQRTLEYAHGSKSEYAERNLI